MEAEVRPGELTSTLHMGLGQAGESPAGVLDEYLATLPQRDRSVFQEIAQSHEKAMLVVNRGSNLGARFLITSAGVMIGRASSSDVFLDDVTVSRTHAKIENSEAGFSIIDSGSLNGTYVNNNSITQHSLLNGDRIQIGKFHLLFVSGRK